MPGFSTMTVANAIAAVRAATAHDNDTQVTDARITAKLITEVQRLVRWISAFAPTIYTTEAAVVLASGVSTYLKSSLSDFERLVRVEKLAGTNYFPLTISDSLHCGNPSVLSVYELPASIEFRPTSAAAGTYRVSYLTIPTAVLTTMAALPIGCEDIAIERAAAWVRQRHDEDPRYHQGEAERIAKEQRSILVRRYGAMPQSGLAITRY